VLVFLSAPRATIFSAPSGSVRCSAFASSHGARIPADLGGNGIVILGGEMDRIIVGRKLARQYPRARIIFSGGNNNLIPADDTSEADFAEELLAGLGSESEQVLIDRKARNTLENAEFSMALARPKPGDRWLLVTSAYHMPRSVGLFRKVGFAIEPYPIGIQKTLGWRQVLTLDSTFLERINQTDAAAHEWLGLIAYRLGGLTSEFLPSPTVTKDGRKIDHPDTVGSL
jgi:uncharacterized SAM-binding protein YcdF (DUF218 family)